MHATTKKSVYLNEYILKTLKKPSYFRQVVILGTPRVEGQLMKIDFHDFPFNKIAQQPIRMQHSFTLR